MSLCCVEKPLWDEKTRPRQHSCLFPKSASVAFPLEKGSVICQNRSVPLKSELAVGLGLAAIQLCSSEGLWTLNLSRSIDQSGILWRNFLENGGLCNNRSTRWWWLGTESVGQTHPSTRHDLRTVHASVQKQRHSSHQPWSARSGELPIWWWCVKFNANIHGACFTFLQPNAELKNHVKMCMLHVHPAYLIPYLQKQVGWLSCCLCVFGDLEVLQQLNMFHSVCSFAPFHSWF